MSKHCGCNTCFGWVVLIVGWYIYLIFFVVFLITWKTVLVYEHGSGVLNSIHCMFLRDDWKLISAPLIIILRALMSIMTSIKHSRHKRHYCCQWRYVTKSSPLALIVSIYSLWYKIIVRCMHNAFIGSKITSTYLTYHRVYRFHSKIEYFWLSQNRYLFLFFFL